MAMIQCDRKFNLNNKPDDVKFPIKFDIAMLNAMIGYIYKETNQITKKAMLNMNRLFNKIDDDIYNANTKMYTRIKFIKRSLDGILNGGILNKDLLVSYAKNVNDDEETQDIINNLDRYTRLNYDEINYISKCVEDRLKYINVYMYKDKIFDTVEKLDRGDYDTLEEINEELVDICKQVVSNHRMLKVMEENDSFSLDQETFEDNVSRIMKRLKTETYILRTGLQYQNDILGGGYYGGRLYTYMALPANFKSGILLKAARDIKKYNAGLKTKSGKQPTVLMITCENDIDETLERLFLMTSSNVDLTAYSTAEAIRLLKEVGEMTITNENNINIVIRYFNNFAISTADLITMIDDLADEGKEVIALIVDYLKRIRPEDWSNEEITQLKNVTNELKNIAQNYKIPVITAMQLNREAARAIDQAALSGKSDLIRQAGRANVGSSWTIVENSDFACIINLEEQKSSGQLFLSFSRVKIRYSRNKRTTFSHPFNLENAMMLLDDVNLDNTLSVDYIGSDFSNSVDFDELLQNNKKKKLSTDDLITADLNNGDDGIFDFGMAINNTK